MRFQIIQSQKPEKYYGREIVLAQLKDERVTLTFSDGVSIQLFDDGQTGRETRYTSSDDDIASLVGGVLRRIEVANGPEIAVHYDVHEQQFLRIFTDQTGVTVVNHNEHNGYYGGFDLFIAEL